MKFKTLLIAALCSTILCMSYAIPSKAAPVKSTKPTRSAKHSTSVKPTIGAVIINAVTRNNSTSKTPLNLAKNGQALLPIVISAKASDATKAVAKELAEYLGKISGATFNVETGDGTSGIVLGTMSDFPTPALDKALEVVNGFDGVEAFAIRTRDKKVLLLGATDLGASHAAFRFLHELGYRHFFPHSAWEVVPSTPSLKWQRDITDRPQILSRSIWFEAGQGTPSADKDYQDWKRHNAEAESFTVSAGHNLTAIVDVNPEVFAQHPEYYALIKQADGTLKRDPTSGQFELGNPVVRKIIAQYAVDFFKKWPDADMVSIEPTDNNHYSQSPESLAMGSISDQVFTAANEAARALQKAYPGQNKMVGLYSYNSTYDPPTFKLEPNVHVQLSSIGVNPTYSSDERWKVWTQRSKNLGVYEYYSVFAWSNDKLPGSYTNGVRDYQRHVRDELAARNVVAISAESTSAWGTNGRGYYVANALLWNPNLDLKALLQDFYTKAFGPAAPSMERYYERLSPDNNPLMSASLLGQAFRDVDEATQAAKNRPDVLARLDQIKLYLRYIDLDWRKWNDGADISSDQIMETLSRSSDYALTSWAMISQSWGGETLYPRGDLAKWPEKKPYTREEIEAGFQSGLEYFKPSIRDNLLPRQKFSTDLVAVKWPNIKPEQNNVESTQSYQGSMKYALWSVKGEPLEFTTEAGDAWGGRTSFEVVDKQGKVLESGKPEPKVLVTHKVQVPKAGLYYLNYNDPGAYWTFNAKPGLLYSIVVLPELTSGRTSRPLQRMYFYVPKGVKELQYFTNGLHFLDGPDGSLQQHVKTGNDWVSVPVPPGMDGKLWSIREASFGKFYFSNAPSYFSPTPEGVLVPREVAIKDGLTIRK